MLDILKKEILPNAEEYCKSNWNDVFGAMQEVFEKLNTSRREGILQLEDGLDDIKPTYFKTLLRAVVDGRDKEYIEDIAVNIFYFKRLSGLEAYLFLIRTYGIFAIESQMYIDDLIRLYWTIMPEGWELEVFVLSERQEMEKMEKLISSGEAHIAFDLVPTEDNFSKLFKRLSKREVLKVLSETDITDLIAATKYSTKEVIDNLIGSMSLRAFCGFADGVKHFNGTKKKSDEAKGKIFAVMNRIFAERN